MEYIVKRDGNVNTFDIQKIISAIKKAFISVDEEYDSHLLNELANSVVNKLVLSSTHLPTVELVQDLVEETLMEHKYYRVAKSYILYREERTKIRNRLSYKEDYNLSFIPHNDYHDEEIIVWDYHDTSDEIFELDVYELFKDGIGELTHIKDVKTFSDILSMKLISYKDYNGIIILKSFQESLSYGIKVNYARYYFDYLEHALSLMCAFDIQKVMYELKNLEVKPDLDDTKYLDGEKAILSYYGLDDMFINHLQLHTLKAAYKRINEVVYYYVNAIDDILLSYQECVSPILPEIRIQLKHPKNIEEQIGYEAVIKITGLGE